MNRPTYLSNKKSIPTEFVVLWYRAFILLFVRTSFIVEDFPRCCSLFVKLFVLFCGELTTITETM